MTRKYEFRDAEERTPLETVVQTTFPTVLQVFQVQALSAAQTQYVLYLGAIPYVTLQAKHSCLLALEPLAEMLPGCRTLSTLLAQAAYWHLDVCTRLLRI